MSTNLCYRWGTVYAHQNLTAKDYFSNWADEHPGNYTSSVPAVSWWKVGKVNWDL